MRAVRAVDPELALQSVLHFHVYTAVLSTLGSGLPKGGQKPVGPRLAEDGIQMFGV